MVGLSGRTMRRTWKGGVVEGLAGGVGHVGEMVVKAVLVFCLG